MAERRVENAEQSGLADLDRDAVYNRIQRIVSSVINDTRAAHGDDLVRHAGNVGKRVASHLWCEFHPGERQAVKDARRAELEWAATEAGEVLRQRDEELGRRAGSLAERHPRLVLGVAAGGFSIEEAEAKASADA